VKIEDIRKLKPAELDKKLSELRLELSKEYGTVKMGRATKNPGKIKEVRRDIAKILTVKNQLKKSAKKEDKANKPKRGKK